VNSRGDSAGASQSINPIWCFQGENGACGGITVSNRSSNCFYSSAVVLGLPVAGSVSSKRLE